MIAQRFNPEVVERIRDGYYGTHESHLSDEVLEQLTHDQLRFYNAQANYFAQYDKNRTLVRWLVALASVLILIIIGGLVYGFLTINHNSSASLHSGEQQGADSSPAAGAQD